MVGQQFEYAFDDIGNPTSATTNGVYRRGDYFRKELSLGNTSGPVWQGVTVSAADGGSSKETGNVFLPRTPESFTHDDDGNLTTNGHWRLLCGQAARGAARAYFVAYDGNGNVVGLVNATDGTVSATTRE